MNTLINLPPGFFKQPELQPMWARLKALGPVRFTSHNTPDEIRADLVWAEAIFMWSWPVLDDALLATASSLKFLGLLDVGRRGARAILDKGIPASVSRGGFSPAVSEMALCLILSLLRRTSDYHAEMRVGTESWLMEVPGGIDPLERELTGREVGLIGLGGVGRRLAELLQPFHCKLRIADPFVPQDVVDRFGAQRVELPALLSSSDVVVICAASNKGSRHLIGAEEIALLRRNAVLVNLARSALLDTPALIARLKKNDLFAAIDVFDKEPLEKDSPLRTLPNAYLTPHRGGGLMISMERIISWLVDDLECHLAGKPQRYPLLEAMLPGLDDQG